MRLLAPQFVKPCVKTNKNDAADAKAICEAVARPNMRFVPIKNIQPQSALALHRVGQGVVEARTAQANQIRGLLGEFGLIIPQGIANVAKRTPELIEVASNELTGCKRSKRQPANPIRDSGQKPQPKSECTGAIFTFRQARTERSAQWRPSTSSHGS